MQSLHHGVSRLRQLQERLVTAGVQVRTRHHVVTVRAVEGSWSLDCAAAAEPQLAERTREVRARRLVHATGAYDRQLPFPGWELPGVMSAGGVQALLKEHCVLAGRSIVVAGTGPFLLPVATAVLAAGGRVPALVEANAPLALARHPGALVGAAHKLLEAAGYIARLGRARTPYLRRQIVCALGDERVEAVKIARINGGGETTTLPCDVLAVGWGFVPQLELHLQLGCATSLATDGSLVVDVDTSQRTSVDGVWAAGEATGIGGSDLALAEGEIAGLGAAGRPARQQVIRKRAALRRFAAALHAAFPVPPAVTSQVDDDVLLCRCEEVTVGAAREAVQLWGATDARTVKMLARPGMGWCQGRICGYATACVTAQACGRPVEAADLRAFAERPLAAPVPLGLLAENGTLPE